MKKFHIVALLLIALSIGAIITAISDSSTYADFALAFSKPGEEFHVVGDLVREKDMEYKPETDPNKFTFHMTDNNGLEKKVILLKSKPQDFEKSEKIVVIGSAKDNDFIAASILMKCPSKYNDGSSEFEDPYQITSK